MTSEQLEQLRQLIKQWRSYKLATGFNGYDNGKESAYQACADALEELLQTFNQDEES